MKNLFYLFAMALLFSTCIKEKTEPDRDPVIRGKVVDIVTQKGVPGIEVQVVDFWTDGWNYSVPITGASTTDSMGNFEVVYTLKNKKWDDRILKLAHLPSYYQQGARINGENESCIFYDLENDSGELFGGYRVEDEGNYTIELMPANTYAYIVTPTIPSNWMADTIEITTWSWENPLDEANWGSWCNRNSLSIEFPMNASNKWDVLRKPNPLKIGDQMTIQYKIYNGNIIRKIEQRSYQCNYNDTTAVALGF